MISPVYHAPVTLGTNTASALSLSGQVLSIGDVFVQIAGDTMSGNLSVPRIGIGAAASADYGLDLQITETVTSGEKRGLSFVLTSNPASASSANFYGFLGFAEHSSNQNKTGNLAGGYVGARKSGTGTMSNIWGLFGEGQLTNTGTVSEHVGLYGYASDYGAATITKSYGLRSLGGFTGTTSDFYSIYAGAAFQINGSGATVTRNYGLYIEDQFIGTTNYGIYLAGTGTANQLIWGGDTNLYRNGANALRTDDTFQSGGYISSDGSAGINTTITTASLVGKTITVKNGIITGFA